MAQNEPQLNTETFKKMLEDERAQLKGDLEDLGRRNPHSPGDWEATEEEDPVQHPADPNLTADQIAEYENRTAVLKQLEIRWNEVTNALERIENGTYGYCEKGEEKHPIEKERLEANPAARTCTEHMNEE